MGLFSFYKMLLCEAHCPSFSGNYATGGPILKLGMSLERVYQVPVPVGYVWTGLSALILQRFFSRSDFSRLVTPLNSIPDL
jgi:hypothetical protein